MFSGFLNIRKPSGVSSFDAIKIVLREILAGRKPEKRVKIGHAGTLDPLADGVLVAAVNQATKLISCVQNQKKTYVATFQLGVESDSEDIETELYPVENAKIPTQAEIENILPEFLGTILQRPPIYSAVHVDGKKAYKLARKGREIEIPPREIFIQSLKLLRYEYPTLVMEIRCGSGTYIRSLGRDIARRLGTGAVMSALTRTAVGVFHIEDALEIRPNDSPEPLSRPHCLEFLRPLSDAVAGMPKVVYSARERELLSNGIPVRLSAKRRAEIQAQIQQETGEVPQTGLVSQTTLPSQISQSSQVDSSLQISSSLQTGSSLQSTSSSPGVSTPLPCESPASASSKAFQTELAPPSKGLGDSEGPKRTDGAGSSGGLGNSTNPEKPKNPESTKGLENPAEEPGTPAVPAKRPGFAPVPFPKLAAMDETGQLLAVVHLCVDGKLRSDVNLAVEK